MGACDFGCGTGASREISSMDLQMTNLFEMRKQHTECLDAADRLLASAEAQHRDLTADEKSIYDGRLAEATRLRQQIAAREAQSTIRRFNPIALLGGGDGPMLGAHDDSGRVPALSAETRTPEYGAALHAFLSTGGKSHAGTLNAGADGAGGYYVPGSERYTAQRRANGMSAAMYESSGAAGGDAITVPTIQQVVPLAVPDLGIYDASMVVPTANDVKIPQQTAFGTSAIKAESTGTIATFGGTDPTLGQITLSAFMVGALRLVSWELLQDVEMWQQFVVDDLLKGQRILEGSLLATGGGTNQPQGVFGNTGTGTGSAYNLAGTAADSTTLLNSLFDVTAQLKGTYQANASWVMSRATGLAIRRAQMQTNLFAPVATVDADGTERILGRPVFFDVNCPALPVTTTAGVVPILYGDFKAGYVIGIRGGAGINVKILDQPWASAGQVGILCYRRLDGKVRRSEAIQAITVSHT